MNEPSKFYHPNKRNMNDSLNNRKRKCQLLLNKNASLLSGDEYEYNSEEVESISNACCVPYVKRRREVRLVNLSNESSVSGDKHKNKDDDNEVATSISNARCVPDLKRQRNVRKKKTSNDERFLLKKRPDLFVTEKFEDLDVSVGVVDLLNASLGNKNPNVYLCATSVGEHDVNCDPIHIQQRDRWSCGYRSLKMMLSSTIQLFPPTHAFFKIFPQQQRPPSQESLEGSSNSSALVIRQQLQRPLGSVVIPGIAAIQEHMERSWKQGFDPKGAKFFDNVVVGKNARIGAVEVASLLSFWYVDCTLIQFVNSDRSRKFLGPFVSSYFSLPIALDSTLLVKASTHLSLVKGTMKMIRNGTNSKQQPPSLSPHHALPLYLQWEGHSVTVIGYEVISSSKEKTMANLLVLDSLKDFASFFSTLERSNASETERKHNAYAQYAHDSKSDIERSIVNATRLPITRVEKRNTQLVLTSPKEISDSHRNVFRRRVQTISAWVCYDTFTTTIPAFPDDHEYDRYAL